MSNNKALEKKDWLFLKENDSIPECYKEGENAGIHYIKTGNNPKNPYPKNTLGFYSWNRGHNGILLCKV